MAHPELEVAQVAIEAISQLTETPSRLYSDVIMSAAPEAIRHLLEAQMEGYEYKSEFAIRYYSEGEMAGLERGRQEGRQEGVGDGLQAAVLTLARAKLDALTREDVAAIEGIRDRQVLDDLVAALGRASSAVEARSVLVIARGYSNSRP